jgi:hypothetical protein
MKAKNEGTDRKASELGSPTIARMTVPNGRPPLRDRVKPFDLAATETCRWYDGPWYQTEATSGWLGDVHERLIACISGDLPGRNLSDRQKKHIRLILAAPLLIAAVEAYRTHCDAPLALTMAVDKLLESID